MLIIGLVSEDGSMTRNDIADYAYSTLQDPIGRVSGVGEVTTFGSPTRCGSGSIRPGSPSTA